jgi:hypothetical protein
MFSERELDEQDVRLHLGAIARRLRRTFGSRGATASARSASEGFRALEETSRLLHKAEVMGLSASISSRGFSGTSAQLE